MFPSHMRDRRPNPVDRLGGFEIAAGLQASVFATLWLHGNSVRAASSSVLFSVLFSLLLPNLLTAPLGRGEVVANPYLGIPERNAFGIKQPPPPPPEPKAVELVKPSFTATLTGFSEFDDGKVVYLMFNPPGAKAPEYSSLREGDVHNGVEILQIDLASESVRIRQNGAESTLDYKSNGNKAAGIPGALGNPLVPPTIATPHAPINGPVVIRRGGVAETQIYAPTVNGGGGAGGAGFGTFPGGGGVAAFPGSPNSNLATPTSGRVPENSMGGGRVIPAQPSTTIPHPRNPNLPAVPIPPLPPIPGGQVFPP